jgi:hypothetical protein
MANQEFPLIALHSGATLLGDALMPQNHRDCGVRGSSRPAPAHKTTRGALLDRLDAWFWRQRQRTIEAHLAQSQDVFELERRMRDLERGIGGRYY